jgi:hypothetical protein
MANRCADYYDHNQLTDEVLADFRKFGPAAARHQPDPPHHQHGAGHGGEDPHRLAGDLRGRGARGRGARHRQEGERGRAESNADRAISNAYAGQIKAGLHWVEVGWHSNPFGYRYRVRDVHRREIWWDWRKREIEEWRYLVRKRRFDADQLELRLPEVEGHDPTPPWTGGTNVAGVRERLDEGTGLGQVIDIERAMTFEEQEWRDFTRPQAALRLRGLVSQVRAGYVARIGDTVIEIDEQEPAAHAGDRARGDEAHARHLPEAAPGDLHRPAAGDRPPEPATRTGRSPTSRSSATART